MGPINTSIAAFRIVGKPDAKFWMAVNAALRRARQLARGRKTWFKQALKGADVAELISVIVTTYNREDALDAVLRVACAAELIPILKSLWRTTAQVRPRRS